MPTINHHLQFDTSIFNFDNSQDLHYLYLIKFVKDFLSKLTGFFIPLFLYQLGSQVAWFDRFSFSQLQVGVFIIASYYLVIRAVVLLTSIFAGKIIAKQGTRLAMLVSILAVAVWLTALVLSFKKPEFIFLAALADGIQISFFYNPFYTLLSRLTKKRSTAQDLSIIQLLMQLAAVVAPAMGGFIISVFGFETLFLFSFFGIFINLIITSLMRTNTYKRVPRLKELRSWLKEKQFRRLNISYAGRYIHEGAMAMWPLYVFIFLGSIEKVGYLYSLSLFLAMLIVLFTGVYADHHKNKHPFFISGGLISLFWLLRTQVFSIWSIAVVDTLDKMTGSFHWLYYDALFLKRAKGSKDLCFFVYREMMISVFAIIFWLGLTVFFLISWDWTSLFLLASAGTLMTLLVSEKYDHID